MTAIVFLSVMCLSLPRWAAARLGYAQQRLIVDGRRA
jgi:hypothetical protein